MTSQALRNLFARALIIVSVCNYLTAADELVAVVEGSASAKVQLPESVSGKPFAALVWISPAKSTKEEGLISLSAGNGAEIVISRIGLSTIVSRMPGQQPIKSDVDLSTTKWYSVLLSFGQPFFTGADGQENRQVDVTLSGKKLLSFHHVFFDLAQGNVTFATVDPQFKHSIGGFVGRIAEARVHTSLPSTYSQSLLELPQDRNTGSLGFFLDFNSAINTGLDVAVEDRITGTEYLLYNSALEAVGPLPYTPINITSVRHLSPLGANVDFYKLANSSNAFQLYVPRVGANVSVIGQNFTQDDSYLTVSTSNGTLVQFDRISETNLSVRIPPREKDGLDILLVSNGPGNANSVMLNYSFQLTPDLHGLVDASYTFEKGCCQDSAPGPDYVAVQGQLDFQNDRNGKNHSAIGISPEVTVNVSSPSQSIYTICAWVLVGEPLLGQEVALFREVLQDKSERLISVVNEKSGVGSLVLDGIELDNAEIYFNVYQFFCLGRSSNLTLFYTPSLEDAVAADVGHQGQNVSSISFGGSGTFVGVVDDVLLFHSLLSRDQIEALFLFEEVGVFFDGSSYALQALTQVGPDLFQSSIFRPNQAFTIQFWINPEPPYSVENVTLFQQDLTEGIPALKLFIKDGVLNLYLLNAYTDDDNFSSSTFLISPDDPAFQLLPGGVWSLLTISLDNMSLGVFLNSTVQLLQESSGSESPSYDLVNADMPLYFGGLELGFRGTISGVQLFSRTLSPDEVSAVFECPETVLEDTFARLHFEGIVNATASDQGVVLQSSTGGAPFLVPVEYYDKSSQPISLGHSYWRPNGTEISGITGVTQRINLQARDSCGMGSLIKAGGQAEVLTARVLGSDGTQLTNTSIVDIGDGTYALYFNATACGLYHIEVSLLGDFQGSNLTYPLVIKGGPANGSLSFLSSSSAADSLSLLQATPGVPNSILLEAYSFEGCESTTLNDPFEVYAVGTGLSPLLNIFNTGPGNYNIHFTPFARGMMQLNVTLNGLFLNGTALGGESLHSKSSPLCIPVTYGGSLYFDAEGSVQVNNLSDDELDMSGPAVLFEFWIAPTTMGGKIISKVKGHHGNPSGYEISLLEEGNIQVDLYVGAHGTNRTLQSLTRLSLSGSSPLWTHVSILYDTLHLSIFMDGELDRSANFTQALQVKPSTAPLRIGANFEGWLDEVRLSNFTGPENFNARHRCPVPPDSTIAYFTFNEGRKLIAHDFSSNQYHGALSSSGVAWSSFPSPSDVGTLDLNGSLLSVPVLSKEGISINDLIRYKIQLKDKCGLEYSANGNDTVDVRVSVQKTFGLSVDDELFSSGAKGHTKRIETNSCLNPSNYEGFVNIPSCGFATVGFFAQGQHISESPYLIDVRGPSVPSVGHSFVERPIHSAVPGLNSTIKVLLRNEYGCPVAAEGSVVKGFLSKVGGYSENGTISDLDLVGKMIPGRDLDNGEYAIDIIVPGPGVYIIDVTVNSKPITNSSFTFSVPPPKAALMNFVSGSPVALADGIAYTNGSHLSLLRGYQSGSTRSRHSFLLEIDRESWSFRRRIHLSSSGEGLARLILDTKTLVSNGKLKSECEDLRILFETEEGDRSFLSIYIDDLTGCYSASTSIWFQPLSAQGQYYIIYGGNQDHNPTIVSGPTLFGAKSQFFDVDINDPFNSSAFVPSVQTNISTPELEPLLADSTVVFSIRTPENPLSGKAIAVEPIGIAGAIGMQLNGTEQEPPFVLRAHFFDSGVENAESWISPNYISESTGICATDPSPNTLSCYKHMSRDAIAVGLFANVDRTCYVKRLSAWEASDVKRSPGWHSLEIAVANSTTIKVDDVPVGKGPAVDFTASIYIRGHSSASGALYWDNIHYAFLDEENVTIGPEESLHFSMNRSVLSYESVGSPQGRIGLDTPSIAFNKNKTKFYMLGGFLSSKDWIVHEYDTLSENFTELLPIGSTRMLKRRDHSVAMDNGSNRLYVYGGRNESGDLLSDLWGFDISLRYFFRIVPAASPQYPSSRVGHVSGVYNGKVYIFGGSDGKEILGDTWMFDLSTHTWTRNQFSPAPCPRRGMGFHIHDEGRSLIITGGYGASDSLLSDIWRLDMLTGRWSEIEVESSSKPLLQRALPSVTSNRENLYIFGGISDQNFLSSIVVFPLRS